MKRFTWPLVLAFAASCSNGFWANCTGAQDPTCCGTRATVTTGATYQGSLPAPDGGAPTQVTLVVGGNVTLVTFTRDGVEVQESYDTLRR